MFTSRELLDRARTELARIAYDSEKALAASLFRHAESLEAKEAVIRELAAACETRLDGIKRLTTELERLQRQDRKK